jgi:hypothetical protein
MACESSYQGDEVADAAPQAELCCERACSERIIVTAERSASGLSRWNAGRRTEELKALLQRHNVQL